MASSNVLTFFILSLTMTTVICQTFQYSRGWTNGKRSSSMVEESASRNAGQLDNALVNCELQKLRLLLQGNVNSQILQQFPCEFFDSPRRNFPEAIINVDHLRRQSTSANNNY
ncbi:pro-corazonin-like [Hylaeus anthracinus]|uniref:pro-corazonin-like n=1 Tax=Hylaeus volcanicus TaxID=313075 RepID=UPI0023B85A17|nr:pro-corazonin-like [Hylaeus volcanicus]XP_054006957.1 pro-corazonin-like [Hylaeus anthracinus]